MIQLTGALTKVVFFPGMRTTNFWTSATSHEVRMVIAMCQRPRQAFLTSTSYWRPKRHSNVCSAGGPQSAVPTQEAIMKYVGLFIGGHRARAPSRDLQPGMTNEVAVCTNA